MHWACAVPAASKMVKCVISLPYSAFEAMIKQLLLQNKWLLDYVQKGENVLRFAIQYSFLAKVILFYLFAFSVVSEGKREQEMSVPRFLNSRRPFRCSFLIVIPNLYLYEAAEVLAPTLFSHADFEILSKQNIIQVCLLSIENLNAKKT